MISVTEFPDGTYDIHDLDSDVWHRGIALADLPGKLVELGCSPHSLDEAKARQRQVYEFDPDLNAIYVDAHHRLAAHVFRDWIATRIIEGSVSSAKVAFEAATGRYAGGLTRIRELLREAGYEVVGDRVRLRKANPSRLPERRAL